MQFHWPIPSLIRVTAAASSYLSMLYSAKIKTVQNSVIHHGFSELFAIYSDRLLTVADDVGALHFASRALSGE